MRFRLLDRIVELEPGKRIVATKQLHPDEEYLRDHFPLFPVMPGVLMLEALFQASMWLVRRSEDFAHAAVLLKEARNVKFTDFVTPGKTLRVEAEILRQDEALTTLKAHGTVDESLAVSGRLILERYHLADQIPSQDAFGPFTCQQMQHKFEELCSATP